jgi:hypothetical protein
MAVAVVLTYPFRGRWRVANSPANRIPSHGTTRFASAHAIDFVPVGPDGRSGRVTPATLVRSEPAELFLGFGRGILAPADGIVVAADDSRPDHRSHRGLPSIGYALTQGRRVRQGWPALAGNHVLIDAGAAVVALCHLQRGSIVVRVGDRVRAGDAVGRCGNSGNSTEPHLHLQAIDRVDIAAASAVAFTFGSALPRNGDIVDAG